MRFVFLLIMMAPFLSFADDCSREVNQDLIVNCLSGEMEIQDKALNRSYEELKKKLPEKEKNALKKSQSSWMKYRDSDCDLQGLTLNGPGAYQPLYLVCVIEMTKTRIKRIEYLRNQF